MHNCNYQMNELKCFTEKESVEFEVPLNTQVILGTTVLTNQTYNTHDKHNKKDGYR